MHGSKTDVLIGYLLVALSALCFGLIPVFARIAYASGVQTATLLFLRFFLGGIFLAVIAYRQRAPLPPKQYWPFLFLLGFIGYSGTSFGYFSALGYASASIVSLLLYTYPALVIILSMIFTSEKISFLKWISLLFASCGCFLVIGFGGEAQSTGVLLALGAAFVYSLYIIISAQIVGKKTAMGSSAFIILSAACSWALMILVQGAQFPKTCAGLLATLSLAFFSTVVAFWSFFAGLSRIGASRASLVSTLEVLVTVLSAIFFLGEKPSLFTLLGGILIVTALVVSLIPDQKKRGFRTSVERP